MQKQIMVVDDEVNIAKLLELSLRRNDYQVLTVNDPFAALRILESVTPDLFVLDIMMPGMDGMELCQRIRARPETATIPIFIFSARSDPQVMRSSISAGATAFYSKKSTRELLDGIKKQLSTPQ